MGTDGRTLSQLGPSGLDFHFISHPEESNRIAVISRKYSTRQRTTTARELIRILERAMRRRPLEMMTTMIMIMTSVVVATSVLLGVQFINKGGALL